MDIEIRKLTPDLAEEYAHFFDTTPHDDRIPDHTCYCVCWCSDDHRFWTGGPTREERRAMAIDYVGSGKVQGYLAYSGSRIVGWCNANTKAACVNCVGWYRFMPQVNEMELDPDEKVKSVYCFLVAPDMKRKGITKRLLQRVCQDALDDGFDCVEAYPEKDAANELKQFMGFVDLYKDIGFTVHGETDRKYVMRKSLKTPCAINPDGGDH